MPAVAFWHKPHGTAAGGWPRSIRNTTGYKERNHVQASEILLSSHVRLGTWQVFHPPATEPVQIGAVSSSPASHLGMMHAARPRLPGCAWASGHL
jgi:hypothetical protein